MKLWKHSATLSELDIIIDRIILFRGKLLEVNNAGSTFIVSYLSKERLI